MKNINGFTLIETVVSTAVVGLLITSMIGIMLNSFQSSIKSKAIERVESEGNFILKEMRRNLLLAKPDTVTCPNANSVYFLSRFDGRDTTFSCGSNKIASVSAQAAKTENLNSDSLTVTCDSFVSCNLSGANPVIEMKFDLQIGNSNDKTNTAKRSFGQTVVVRH